MNLDWIVLVNGVQQGPYSAMELKKHPGVNLESLVRKKNETKWTAIRFIPELKKLFEKRALSKPLHCQNKDKQRLPLPEDLTLSLPHPDPFFSYFWLIVSLFFIIYSYYFIYG